jgi:hypothetical protein
VILQVVTTGVTCDWGTGQLELKQLKGGWKMFYGTSFVVTCLYGMKVKPDPKRDKKLKSAIEYLGEKYCLAKPVEKING